MRIADVVIIFTVFIPNLRETVAITTGSSILSTTRSTILKAVESIQLPYDGIADPDKILDEPARRNLANILHRHSSCLIVNCRGQIVVTSTRNQNANDAQDNKQGDIDIDNAEFPVQIAVAVVESMELVDNDISYENDDDVEELAGQFATSLHNKWGVGQEIILIDKDGITGGNCDGGTGVLVFMSIRDRIVFISVGGALSHLLTSDRIDHIIHNDMRADLNRANYELGLTKGIDAIAELLEKGEEPSVFEQISDKWSDNSLFLAFVWIIAVFGNEAFQRWKRRREQRIYAQAALRLSELDRTRAEELRRSYTRTSCCPICLEDFSSTVVGSDGHPIQLLRCGHAFDKSCYQNWVSSGYCDVTKCPVCRTDIGFSLDDLPTTSTSDNSVYFRPFTANTISEEGNDHNDSSRINNSDSDLPSIVTNNDGITFAFDDDNDNDSKNLARRISWRDTNRMILYQRNRNYRLQRLSDLYPRFITTDAVTRWSSRTFTGSLVSDPCFRIRDPAVTKKTRRYCSSPRDNEHGFSSDDDYRENVTFSGGTSAGGKGGRF